MTNRVQYVFYLFLSCILMLYLYTFLHEIGHAIVAIMSGGQVDQIVLGFNAHVQTSGAIFTTLSESLFHVMGVLLPVIVLIIAVLLYKPQIKDTFYHIFYGFLSISIIGSVLAWIIVPVISLFTLPPSGDDVTHFLDISGLHPLIVALTAIFLIMALGFFVFKRGIIGKLKQINLDLLQSNQATVNKMPLTRMIIGILLGSIIIALSLNGLISKPVLQTTFQMDVSTVEDEMRVPFKIEKNKSYAMNFDLQADGFLTDVQIYRDDGTLIYQNICEWMTLDTAITFETGNYELVLTYLKDIGSMQEHFSSKDYKFETEVLEQFEKMLNSYNADESHQVSFSVIIK